MKPNDPVARVGLKSAGCSAEISPSDSAGVVLSSSVFLDTSFITPRGRGMLPGLDDSDTKNGKLSVHRCCGSSQTNRAAHDSTDLVHLMLILSGRTTDGSAIGGWLRDV